MLGCFLYKQMKMDTVKKKEMTMNVRAGGRTQEVAMRDWRPGFGIPATARIARRPDGRRATRTEERVGSERD